MENDQPKTTSPADAKPILENLPSDSPVGTTAKPGKQNTKRKFPKIGFGGWFGVCVAALGLFMMATASRDADEKVAKWQPPTYQQQLEHEVVNAQFGTSVPMPTREEMRDYYFWGSIKVGGWGFMIGALFIGYGYIVHTKGWIPPWEKANESKENSR